MKGTDFAWLIVFWIISAVAITGFVDNQYREINKVRQEIEKCQ